MSDKTKIEWSEATWNPITGCTKVGAGCDFCYAEAIANRLQGTKAFPNGFELTWKPHLLDQPLRWKRPRMIFVNSMSDLFHKDVVRPKKDGPIPECALDYIFNRMEKADHHIYQILTKRSSLMRDWINERYDGNVPKHIWLGVSVEDDAHTGRIDHLKSIKGDSIKFISFEPLLGPMRALDLEGIHWAIVGGESGRGARPMEIDQYDENGLPSSSPWVRDIQKMCMFHGVTFFFKQWGGANKKKTGRLFEGREWNGFPSVEAIGAPTLFAGAA